MANEMNTDERNDNMMENTDVVAIQSREEEAEERGNDCASLDAQDEVRSIPAIFLEEE